MHVTREPAPLLERRGCHHARPVRGDLTRRPDQQDEVEAEPENVACVDPCSVYRWVEEVVDARRSREDAGDREPPTELVGGEAVPPHEAERRQQVQQRQGELEGPYVVRVRAS